MHMVKKVSILILLMFFSDLKSLHAQSNCWYHGEIIDSTSCDGWVWLYQHLPIDTMNGTHIVIYWGNGDSLVIQTNNFNYPQFIPYQYNQPGTYYPYAVLYSPCVDTFPIFVHGSGAPTNSVTYLDSCRQISGYAYVDANNNCSYDMGEGIPYAFIKAFQNGSMVDLAYTNQNGYYTLFVGANSPYDLDFDYYYLSTLTATCGSSANPTGLNGNNYDFKFTCNNQSDLEVSIHNNSYSPVFNRYVYFSVKNKGCGPSLTSVVKIVLPSDVNLINSCSWNSFNAPMNIVGDTVIFSGLLFSPYTEFWGYLCVIGDSTLTMGDTLCAEIWVDIPNDANYNNNYDMDCSPVLNSYDPNMKEVAINGEPAEGFVPANEIMTYTLHFQNTGNAPALNVVIRDTLSNNLDINTFQFIDASHNVQVNLNTNSREVVFNFSNIMLPDSATNPAGSQGYVKFKIAQQLNLSPGTVIPNNCSIYFDYNPAIVTNTVVSIIQSPTSKNTQTQTEYLVYPNPASDKLFIHTNSNHQYLIQIFDLSGKLLLNQNSPREIHINTLPTGLYILKITDEKGNYQSYKFIKE